MQKLIWAFLIGTLLNSSHTLAGNSVDITASTAIPSNCDALTINPAALAVYTDPIFDLSSHFNSGPADLSGAITGNAGGVGYGLEVQNSIGRFNLRGGFGGEIGKFAIGMSAQTDLSSQTPTFTVGLRQDLQKYSIALVFNSLMAPLQAWSFGFGIPVSNDFKVGADLHFTGSTATFISNSILTFTAAFLVSEHYAFLVNNSFNIMPTMTADFNPGLGISYWIGRKVAIYGLYQMNAYHYVVGLKFII